MSGIFTVGTTQAQLPSSQLTPSSQANPCPVCGKTNGNCRTTNGGLVLCMTQEQAPGWHSLGLTKDGTWTKFVPNTGETTAEQRDQLRRENQARRARLEAEEAARAAEAMPAAKRNRCNLQLLSQLDLHSEDRADLEQRGFTAEQIKQIGFKSVQQWQQLEHELPNTLPGITVDGQSLNVAAAGYLCPIRNADGFIVGMQLRVRGTDNNKYRWLSSRTRKRPHGQQPKTREFGENPLSVYRGDSGIALVEGTGPKPALAAARLNTNVIGAAGGQWASSPQTLKDEIAKLGSGPISLYLDAGDTAKPQVMRRWHQTAGLLKDWGHKVSVWIPAGDRDIDELSASELENIELVPAAKLPQLLGFGSNRPARHKRQATQPKPTFDISTIKQREQQAWIQDFEQRLSIELSPELEQARVQIEAALREEQQLSQDSAVRDWCPQLEPGSNQQRKMFVLDAQKMTGKSSSAIASLVRKPIEHGEFTLILVPYRSLTADMARMLRRTCDPTRIITHGEYKAALANQHNPKAQQKLHAARCFIACPESLHLFKHKPFELFIADEANEVFGRVKKGNLGNHPRENRAAFKKRLSQAHTVVVSSDQLYRNTIQGIATRGGFAPSEIETIQRRRPQFGQTQPEIELYIQQPRKTEKWDGTASDDSSCKNPAFTGWLAELVSDISQGERVAIPCGSQTKAREIARILRLLCPEAKGQVIDGQYTPKLIKQAFVSNADGWLSSKTANRPDGTKSNFQWIAFTQTCNSGVSVDGLHFDAQYDYVSGFEAATSASQRGERIRDVIRRERIKKRRVYISAQGLSKLPCVDVFFPEYWQRLIEADTKIPAETRAIAWEIGANEGLSVAREEPQYAHELAEIWAIECREIFFKVETLKAEWQANGWQVTEQAGYSDPRIEQACKRVAENLLWQKSRILAKSEPETQHIEEPSGARQLFGLKKTGQIRKLGEAFEQLNSEHWQAAWAIDPAARGAISAMQVQACLQIAYRQPEVWADVVKLAALRTLSIDAEVELPDLPISALIIRRAQLLKEAPFIQELIESPELTYTKADSRVKAAATYAREHSTDFAASTSHWQRIRGYQFTENTPDIKCLHKMLAIAGIEAHTVGRASGKYKYWQYQLKVPPANSAQLIEEFCNQPAQAGDKTDASSRELFRLCTASEVVSAASNVILDCVADNAVQQLISQIKGDPELQCRENLTTEVLDPFPDWPPQLVQQWAQALQSCQSWAQVLEITEVIPVGARQTLWNLLGRGSPARIHVKQLQRLAA